MRDNILGRLLLAGSLSTLLACKEEEARTMEARDFTLAHEVRLIPHTENGVIDQNTGYTICEKPDLKVCYSPEGYIEKLKADLDAELAE